MLGQRIRSLRKERKMTQQELAGYLKLAKSTISQYENNINEPDNITLQKIADIFNVSTDYLLGRTDNPAIHDSEKNLTSRSTVNNRAFKSTINDDDSRPATKEDIERLLSHNPELKEMTLLFLESPPGIKKAVKNILKEFKEQQDTNDK